METDGQNKEIVVKLSANPLPTIINWQINGKDPESIGTHKIYTSPNDASSSTSTFKLNINMYC